MKQIILLIAICVLFICTTFSQEIITYKQIDTLKLNIEVLNPPEMNESVKYPAMVFFHGGGWNGGSRKHFESHAQYFAQRGLVCFLVDYRINKIHSTSPFESLKDAKSAMRYIRVNADKFNIDPNKIIAAGGSAGGHLAAASALINGYNEISENSNTSCVPNALVLFNPVIDNGPGGYGYERIGEEYRNFSPLHNINKGAPPTIIFLGTKDKLIPVETAEYYKVVMEKVGSRCDLHLYKDQTHGFFNTKNIDNYKSTVSLADEFLQSLGYLKPEPKVAID